MAQVFTPADAKSLALPGRVSREIVSGEHGAEKLSFRYVEIAPLAPGQPNRGPHFHQGFEECIYVLSGSGVTETDGIEYPFEAGDTILIPAGELHATRAQEKLTLLCFFPTDDVASGTTEFPSWEAARSAR